MIKVYTPDSSAEWQAPAQTRIGRPQPAGSSTEITGRQQQPIIFMRKKMQSYLILKIYYSAESYSYKSVSQNSFNTYVKCHHKKPSKVLLSFILILKIKIGTILINNLPQSGYFNTNYILKKKKDLNN